MSFGSGASSKDYLMPVSTPTVANQSEANKAKADVLEMLKRANSYNKSKQTQAITQSPWLKNSLGPYNLKNDFGNGLNIGGVKPI